MTKLNIAYKYSIFSMVIKVNYFIVSYRLNVLRILYLTLLPSHDIRYSMADEKYFLQPRHEWQRRYEALRASFVDRLPAKAVAERFSYSAEYIHLLRHQFKQGKIDFSEPVPEGKVKRRRVELETREKIKTWREQKLSAGEITELLSEDGVEISVRTVERVIAEEGFP